MSTEQVSIDGAHGEGGGQILRTALTLSALSGRPFAIDSLRAGHRRPGLRPQHLATVRAMQALCEARVEGDHLDSQSLRFLPRRPVTSGEYAIDIGAMAGTPSAGAASLLLQTLLLPLALADGPSRVRVTGGTHVAWSPPYHYLAEVYLPVLERLGVHARLELGKWGWYPRGGGEIVAHVEGRGAATESLRPLVIEGRGRLTGVWGVSAASNLPEHIIQRQRSHALQHLRARHIKADIEAIDAPSPGPGTVLFLLAEYEHVSAGFTGYGRLRYPAEKVAEDAIKGFEAHLKSQQALDPHLADQILLPLALAPGSSSYTTSCVTRHLQTVQWAVQQFVKRGIVVEGKEGGPGTVVVR